MNFKKWSIALFAIALVAPLSASALGISVTNVTYGGNGDALLDNEDTVTFDLLLENASGANISGLDVGVFGYDSGAVGSAGDNNLVFSSALASASAFNVVYNAGTPFGGLDNATGVQETGNPVVFQERFLRVFGGVAVTPVTGDGTQDVGVASGQTNGGDVHFQVTFSAQSLGATHGAPSVVNLDIGVGQFGFAVIADDGSNPVAFNNASLQLTIVPEPGTALLMGLGLAGLAGIRRR